MFLKLYPEGCDQMATRFGKAEDKVEAIANSISDALAACRPESDGKAGHGHLRLELPGPDGYELQAIGHDGMAADDVSKGGGHFREVEKVSSFLEGFRKAEERRVARETSTMLLDRLVKGTSSFAAAH